MKPKPLNPKTKTKTKTVAVKQNTKATTTEVKHEIIKGCPDFKQIVHLSDIHIHKCKRHDEYRHCFEHLYRQLREMTSVTKDKTDSFIIVITGDLFENKRDFRPETWDLATDFLTALADIAFTIIIAGNHDMLERNTTIVDSITPLVKNIKRLHYCRYSGIYETPAVNFVVSSLYDRQFVDARQCVKLREKNNKPLVALYHGTVTKTATKIASNPSRETHETSSRFRSISDFQRFDAVLLGDLHQCQMITEKMGYAGSLIQQNQGEPIDGHGFLLWKIHTDGFRSEFVELPNQWAHVTIRCRDDRIVDSHEMERCHAKKLYLRITSQRCSPITVRALVKQYMRNHYPDRNIVSLTVQNQLVASEEGDEMSRNNEVDNEVEKTDTVTAAAQSAFDDWLVATLRNKHRLNMLRPIRELHKEYCGQQSGADKRVYWRPIWMEFQNMFGFGGDKTHQISFESQINCLTAPNRSGKTSIINTLLFALFGATPLSPSSRTFTYDVVHNQATHGHVMLLLLHDQQYYLIERKSIRQKSSKTTSIGLKDLRNYSFRVELWQSDRLKRKIKLLTHQQRQGTDIKLKQMIGDLSSFRLLNMINKESNLSILDMSAGQRLKSFQEMFGLQYLSQCRQLNQQRLKDHKALLIRNTGQLDVLRSEMASQTTPGMLAPIDSSNLAKTVKHHDQMINSLDQQIQETNKRIHRMMQYQRVSKTLALPLNFPISAWQMHFEETLDEDAALDISPEQVDHLIKQYQDSIKECTLLYDLLTPDDHGPSLGFPYKSSLPRTMHIKQLLLEERELIKQIAVIEERLKANQPDLPPFLSSVSLDRAQQIIEFKIRSLKDLINGQECPEKRARVHKPDVIDDMTLDMAESRLKLISGRMLSLNINTLLAEIELLPRARDDGLVTISIDLWNRILSFLQGDYEHMVVETKELKQIIQVLQDHHKHNLQVAYNQRLFELITSQSKYVGWLRCLTEHQTTRQQLTENLCILNNRKANLQAQKYWVFHDTTSNFMRVRSQLQQWLEDQLEEHGSELVEHCHEQVQMLHEDKQVWIGAREIIREQLRYHKWTQQHAVRVGQQIEQLEVTNQDLIGSVDLYQTYADLFSGARLGSRSGSRSGAAGQDMISNMLHMRLSGLQAEINRILLPYTNYRLEISSTQFICRNSQTNQALSCSRLSGYEKLVLELALKACFNKYCAHNRSSMFIVDEGFDVMDQSNFDRIDRLCAQLHEEYDTLVLISQRELSLGKAIFFK